MTRFSESFWNQEFCNFSGFDVLCKRMKDGKQMTKDYADFLKIRAQAQETYGKSLVKLAKMIGGRDEIGTLRQAWEIMRSETESIGQAHIRSATVVMDEMTKVLEFMDTQREQRRKVEDNVRRLQNNIKTLYKKCLECKKTYEVRTREADQAIKALAAESAKLTSLTKDLEKLKMKQSKTSQNADLADANYRGAIEALESGRQQWEQETETACDIFQQLEEDRIQYIRNSMWVACNAASTACVSEDELQEEIRKILEKCDADVDIQTFIRQRQTGSERPAPIEFENYFGGQTEKNENPVTNKNLKNHVPDNNNTPELPKTLITPVKPIVQNSIKTDTVEAMENDTLYGDIYETLSDSSATPTTPTIPITPTTPENHSPDKKVLCKVMYDFDGRNDEELSLHEDDVVTLVCKENSDWWKVETTNGITGYYPANYLELM